MNFYCQVLCGDVNFSIDEWNKQFKLCNELRINIPEPTPCKEQCFDCLVIVGKTRDKNKILKNVKS